MSAEMICDVCLKKIDSEKPEIHKNCRKAIEFTKYSNIEDYSNLKELIEKHLPVSAKFDEIKRTELASKPGLIILNNRVVALSMVGCNLTEFPKELCNLVYLRELHLSKNSIQVIPSEIQQLKKLKELYLDSNNIAEIHPNIQFLTRLLKLNLNNNKITEIPKELLLIKGLEQLDMDENKITKIPDEIENLWILNHASFKDNTIEELPEAILKIRQLSDLFVTPNDALLKKYPELELKEDAKVWTHKLSQHYRTKNEGN